MAAKNKVVDELAAPRLSADQLAEVTRMLGDVDSVELKVVVPMSTQAAAVKKLGLDPVEAEPRQVIFFDTPNFDLDKAGVVVRARRIQGGTADTVIKLRPVDPSAVDDELRRSASWKTEIDFVPGGYVCSGSVKGKCKGQEVLDAVEGKLPLPRMFSREQRAFYARHAPKGLALGSLQAFGPIFLLKARQWSKTLDRRLVVEVWLFPDGTRNLEISTKAEPNELFQVGEDLKSYLRGIGIEITGNQQTKTRAAMEFFRAGLVHPGPKRASGRRSAAGAGTAVARRSSRSGKAASKK
jgi:hypothetical protein